MPGRVPFSRAPMRCLSLQDFAPQAIEVQVAKPWPQPRRLYEPALPSRSSVPKARLPGQLWERLPGAAPTVCDRVPGTFRLSPVIFPPGRARLDTSPSPTGSEAPAVTMGIVELAFIAILIAGPTVTMTSTLRATNSAARFGSRSSLPSAYRYSMTTFFRSTYRSSCSR